jgi:hypothetical protein
MDTLLKLLASLTDRLKTLVVSKNAQTAQGLKLYETALSFIGQDASPKDTAPDLLGCVDSLEQVYFRAFGEYLGGGISTLKLYHALKNNKKFVLVTSPIAGDIILSPTGMATQPSNIKNGHCGIVGQNGKIMSNNSSNGKWEQNYDTWSWRNRWVTNGGYPQFLFRKVL